MAEKEEKAKEITSDLSNLRKEIVQSKEQLDSINNDKEKHYTNKKKIDESLNKIFDSLKGLKAKRDKLNSEIKIEKEKRDKLKQETDKKIIEIKKIRNEVNQLKEKLKIEDPSIVEKKIRKMEFYLETQPMDYSKEKQIRENIRKIKSSLKKVGQSNENWSKYVTITKEIQDLKDKIKSITITIKSKAKQARTFHNELLKSSSQIPDLKEKRKEEWSKFVELKKKYLSVKDQIKDKVTKKSILSQKLSKKKKKDKEETEKAIKVNFTEKKKELDEKIKGKKKLTTKDLLLFQKINQYAEKSDN